MAQKQARKINFSTKLLKFFTLNNDGSTFNAADDYAGAEVKFTIKPPSDEIWTIREIAVCISDNSTLNDGDKYGANITLTNGIGFEVRDGTITTLPIRILANRDWLIFTDHLHVLNFSGSSVKNVVFTTDLSALDREFTLDGSENEEASYLIHDDLSALVHQLFIARGQIQKIQT